MITTTLHVLAGQKCFCVIQSFPCLVFIVLFSFGLLHQFIRHELYLAALTFNLGQFTDLFYTVR